MSRNLLRLKNEQADLEKEIQPGRSTMKIFLGVTATKRKVYAFYTRSG